MVQLADRQKSKPLPFLVVPSAPPGDGARVLAYTVRRGSYSRDLGQGTNYYLRGNHVSSSLHEKGVPARADRPLLQKPHVEFRPRISEER